MFRTWYSIRCPIVDPTAAQFASPVSLEHYRAWKPGDEVKVGRCMWCGADIYRTVQKLGGAPLSICSEECEDACTRDMEEDMRRLG